MANNTQLDHQHHTPSGIKHPLSIIACDITSAANIGSLFRLCDALGIQRLYLCGGTPVPPDSKIRKTSRSTEDYVHFEYTDDATNLVTSLKADGGHVIALEITTTSIDIRSDTFKDFLVDNKPVYLVLGSEKSGVSDELLAQADITVHIPMLGNNSSMNVVTAAAIACYEITGAMR